MKYPQSHKMDVLILCGGMGTRLKEKVQDRPKSMADIHGKPFLDILIEYVASFGFKRFILCTGYQSDFIENYYKNILNVSYLISREESPLGTAGALKNAEQLMQSDMFLAINGDSFCRVNLKSFLSFHNKKNAYSSIVVTKTLNADSYGTILFGEHQEITQFNEKIKRVGSGWSNAGIYLIARQLLTNLPPNKKISLEYDFFPSLLGKGLYAYQTDEKLFDIGTPERLEIAKQSL